ncbi:hypothetical protein PO227_22530, partial [Bacteroides ovatus]|nr:hypothetical protein [Bacteroides ovatus]
SATYRNSYAFFYAIMSTYLINLRNLNKTISERETAYTKEHLFLSSSQKSKIKRILGETAHIIENYRNELRIIAHAHEQENREY